MKTEILSQLETVWAGRNCLCFDVLDSTNDYGKELAKKQPVHGTLIVADTQTAGKGRRGRIWQSPGGTTISMSLCLEPKLQADQVSGLTLVAALSVAEAIREVTGADPRIKWPNDIVLNGKKICGILTEMCFKENTYAVVIGIGINVNTESFPEEIQEVASSLKLETGKEISREKLIAFVMKYFEMFYEQYEQRSDLTLLKQRYERMLANKDREVQVLDPVAPYTGIARGITAAGNLVVVCRDGTEKEVSSGEVSVRGLYGYVS